MAYPTYLVHFNKNHSSKDGKFTYGDGDGDGIINDHKNQIESSLKRKGYSDRQISEAMKSFDYTASKVGNNKTKEAYYKYVEQAYSDKENEQKIRKALLDYSKIASKDIKSLEKSGDTKKANEMNAVRMTLLATDASTTEFAEKYMSMALNDFFADGNTVDPSKPLNFVFNAEEEFGGVSITFKDYSNKKYYVKE